MNFNHKNKKGEITTKQLVVIIILIVSFIIVLFLLFRLNLGEKTNKEICHNSVVLRDRAGVFSGTLDCRINYLCISGGGDCKGITPTATFRVSTGTSQKNETMKALADEMADCWWMFGEGKIDYSRGKLFPRTACAICSIVEFDEKLYDTSITYEEFYNYLRTTPKTSTQTYLNYLYSVNTLGDLREEFNPENYFEKSLEFDKTYFILTGITKSAAWGLFDSDNVPVTILERTPENYEAIGCDIFLTKA